MWIRLGEALGVPREEMEDERHVLPGVRFATEAYVTFCKTKPWIDGVASSLTELFAPDLMRQRIAAFPQHYPWVRPEALDYFKSRLTQAPRDSQQAAPRADALHDRRDAAAGVRGAGLQARAAVGDDRHDSPRLRGAELTWPSSPPTSVPALWRLARLDFDPVRQQRVLLYPEGVVLLNDTGAAILDLCDGRRSIAEIAADPRGALSLRRHRRRHRVSVGLVEQELVRVPIETPEPGFNG